jgi:phosphatidylserine/phosphatidylglycerophosphate/cardiolipin synthase-like enzyme
LAVAYFQIAIVLSIIIINYAITILFPSKGKWLYLLYIVPIGWTIWTFYQVHTLKLTLVQLFTIWATHYVLLRLHKNKNDIEEMRQKLDGYSREKIKTIQGIINSGKNVSIIIGDKHREVLQGTVRKAESIICILSGWATEYVIDDKFEKLLKDALQRGVNIYLGFGWTSSTGRDRETNAVKVAKEKLYSIQDWSRTKAGKLYIAEYPNHAKILICDEKYAICGSNNWLSNNIFSNEERSWQISEPSFVREEKYEIVTVIQNKINQDIKDIAKLKKENNENRSRSGDATADKTNQTSHEDKQRNLINYAERRNHVAKIYQMKALEKTDISDERLLNIRKLYRRAYEPWDEEEDQYLQVLYALISNVDDLSTIFQRQPSAISARLSKLNE